MDSSKFVKLCKDCGIIEEPRFKLSDAGGKAGLNSNLNNYYDLDLLFQRSKKAGNYGKKIFYEDFRSNVILTLF